MLLNTNQAIEIFPLQYMSSSEDSNSSWQFVNPLPQNLYTPNLSNDTILPLEKKLPNSELSEVILKELRQRYNGRSSSHQTDNEVAQQSLELMRETVQSLFDSEIQVIVQKYIETYFEPAVKNIKENVEHSGISDECLKKISCDLLEHAKQGYQPPKQQTLELNVSNEVSHITKPVETISPEELFLSYTSPPIKRKEPTVTLTRSLSSNSYSPAHKRTPIAFQSKCFTRPNQIIVNVTLTTDTLFTFDFKVHEAFEYAPTERLIYKYPELIHYAIDFNDKDWFIQQRILSPVHRNSHILLLTIEEVNRIAHDDILSNQPYPKSIELLGFKIPEFMLQKMRKYINEKVERNRTFIANPVQSKQLSTLLASAAVPTGIKTIQSINPILKSQLQNMTPFSFSSMNSLMTNSLMTNSLMTNSLMTNSQPTTVLLVDTSGNGQQTATITNAFITTDDGPLVSRPVITRSSLSSSHATLSALLSNSPTEKTLNSIVLSDILD